MQQREGVREMCVGGKEVEQRLVKEKRMRR